MILILVNLSNKTDYNAKIKDVEDKIPSITNLTTNAFVTAVEDKKTNVNDLVKKVDYNEKIKDIESKYLTASDYNKFSNNILDAKITKKKKKKVNKSGLDEKIKNLAIKGEFKKLVTKVLLKAKQDKISKL